MKHRFRYDWGFTGHWGTVGYYHGDHNGCSRLDPHGDHNTHYSSGHNWNGHTTATSIRHPGYHFTWQLWDASVVYGKTVDIVAHSMGGLIARYAIMKTEEGHPSFPDFLRVEDVVTMGTPHGGGRWWTNGCTARQCDEMHAGSYLLTDMESSPSGWDPDTRVNTDWSTFGSDEDNAVAADRAAGTARDRSPSHDYIRSCHKTWYLASNGIEHSDFQTDTTSAETADVLEFHCGQGWSRDRTSYWPVRRAARADLGLGVTAAHRRASEGSLTDR